MTKRIHWKTHLFANELRLGLKVRSLCNHGKWAHVVSATTQAHDRVGGRCLRSTA